MYCFADGQIRGPLGPIAYPGGHVLIYSLFYLIFGEAESAHDAKALFGPRLVFIFVQLALTKVVHLVYAEASPTTAHIDCIFFLTTVRGRNLFANGLFNDAFQVIFCYLGIWSILKGSSASTILLCFSAGLSFKLSAILYAPAVAYHILLRFGLRHTVLASGPALALQFAVALPFLIASPVNYFQRSFTKSDFGWYVSMNWKWVSEETFDSAWFARTLLFFQLFYISLTLYLLRYRPAPLPKPGLGESPAVSKFHVAALIFATHFSGFIFAPSMHYHFLIWVLHALPLLYRAARLSFIQSALLHTVLELSWNGWLSGGVGDPLRTGASWPHALAMTFGNLGLQLLLIRSFLRVDEQGGTLEVAGVQSEPVPLD
jgi:alpha-1,3-mannosyltransferase